jgi:hypothetical protein
VVEKRRGACCRGVPTTGEDARLAAHRGAALVRLFKPRGERADRLRKVDGWQKIGAVVNQHTAVAA